MSYFNPRSREGSDLTPYDTYRQTSRFQSTLPRGERPCTLILTEETVVFQSTLPRGERLCCVSYIFVSLRISIHAPARGATMDRFVNISIFSNFNPRSREGSDQNVCSFLYMLHNISIHAPARGATTTTIKHDGSEAISIHAPARGATIANRNAESNVGNFNPRSREGSDKQIAIEFSSVGISIHAPARGATESERSRFITQLLFQSTLPRGERPLYIRFSDM